MTELTEKLGARIRMYRKLNGCSLADFSKAINKSRSTISKYEHGEITIDIETIYEIAAFFHVSVPSLLGEGTSAKQEEIRLPAFFDKEVYYLYLYNGIHRELQHGVLELNNETGAVSLYLYFPDLAHYRDCSFLCQGDMHTSSNSNIINFVLDSYPSRDSTVHLCFYQPVRPSEQLLIGHISSHMLPTAPMCTKCVLSKRPLNETPDLVEFLKFTKSELAHLKKDNILSVQYSINTKNL